MFTLNKNSKTLNDDIRIIEDARIVTYSEDKQSDPELTAEKTYLLRFTRYTLPVIF
jgi:hypothetical protein